MGILLVLAPIMFFVIVQTYKNEQYKNGAYYRITKNSHSSAKYDKGKYAEYLTYESLRYFENNGGKFLFNVLIPTKYNGSTEIDVLLICSKGIFVFECKNFSGWIFGHEAQRNWTQTLPQGRGRCHKEHFYNPIKQNASHIKHLKNLVGWKIPMWSIIVFSDRCVLKDITIRNNNIKVINHYEMTSVVTQIFNQTETEIYTEIEINDIYNKLFPYTQHDYAVREQHIKSIRGIF